MTFISVSLPDTSPDFLKNLFDLCVNLRTYIISPTSIPIPIIVDANSLYEFNQITTRILIMIHNELTVNGHSNESMLQSIHAPLDFIVNMTTPYMTKRWHLKFEQSSVLRHLDTSDNQTFEIGT